MEIGRALLGTNSRIQVQDASGHEYVNPETYRPGTIFKSYGPNLEFEGLWILDSYEFLTSLLTGKSLTTQETTAKALRLLPLGAKDSFKITGIE